MRFLLDVCVSSRSLIAFLTDQGHDVLSAVEVDPLASDENLLLLAQQQDRILITEDKDFGRLIFLRKLPPGTIVRLVEMTVENQIKAMIELLDQHPDALASPALITVTAKRIRIHRWI